MFKILIGFIIVVVFLAAIFMTGCSKNQQRLAGLSILSSVGTIASVLNSHFKRNNSRKRTIANVSYDAAAK